MNSLSIRLPQPGEVRCIGDKLVKLEGVADAQRRHRAKVVQNVEHGSPEFYGNPEKVARALATYFEDEGDPNPLPGALDLSGLTQQEFDVLLTNKDFWSECQRLKWSPIPVLILPKDLTMTAWEIPDHIAVRSLEVSLRNEQRLGICASMETAPESLTANGEGTLFFFCPPAAGTKTQPGDGVVIHRIGPYEFNEAFVDSWIVQTKSPFSGVKSSQELVDEYCRLTAKPTVSLAQHVDMFWHAISFANKNFSNDDASEVIRQLTEEKLIGQLNAQPLNSMASHIVAGMLSRAAKKAVTGHLWPYCVLRLGLNGNLMSGFGPAWSEWTSRVQKMIDAMPLSKWESNLIGEAIEDLLTGLMVPSRRENCLIAIKMLWPGYHKCFVDSDESGEKSFKSIRTVMAAYPEVVARFTLGLPPDMAFDLMSMTSFADDNKPLINAHAEDACSFTDAMKNGLPSEVVDGLHGAMDGPSIQVQTGIITKSSKLSVQQKRQALALLLHQALERGDAAATRDAFGAMMHADGSDRSVPPPDAALLHQVARMLVSRFNEVKEQGGEPLLKLMSAWFDPSWADLLGPHKSLWLGMVFKAMGATVPAKLADGAVQTLVDALTTSWFPDAPAVDAHANRILLLLWQSALPQRLVLTAPLQQLMKDRPELGEHLMRLGGFSPEARKAVRQALEDGGDAAERFSLEIQNLLDARAAREQQAAALEQEEAQKARAVALAAPLKEAIGQRYFMKVGWEASKLAESDLPWEKKYSIFKDTWTHLQDLLTPPMTLNACRLIAGWIDALLKACAKQGINGDDEVGVWLQDTLDACIKGLFEGQSEGQRPLGSGHVMLLHAIILSDAAKVYASYDRCIVRAGKLDPSLAKKNSDLEAQQIDKWMAELRPRLSPVDNRRTEEPQRSEAHREQVPKPTWRQSLLAACRESKDAAWQVVQRVLANPDLKPHEKLELLNAEYLNEPLLAQVPEDRFETLFTTMEELQASV